MLANLQIQNIGLIDYISVDFRPGLNILTGETGAGKSMIIGSIDALLGGDMTKSLRREEDSLIEGLFIIDENNTAFLESLEGLGLEKDRHLVLSRKMSGGRSIFRANGQMLTKAAVLALRAGLFDIHSQREHQSLLQVKNHILMLDRYFAKEVSPLTDLLGDLDGQLRAIGKMQAQSGIDEASRLREIDFLQYEIQEIEKAALKEQEDEDLEQELALLQNSRHIKEALQVVAEAVSGDYGSRNQIAQAAHGLQRIKDYDGKLNSIWDQLVNVEDILHDVAKEADRYLDSVEGYEERLFEVEDRLNQINNLKAKYGNRIDQIIGLVKEKQERLQFLENIAKVRADLKQKQEKLEREMQVVADRLSAIRKKAGSQLEKEMSHRLTQLNFNNSDFMVHFTRKKQIQADGQDEISFYISTNKGEPLKPLIDVASGGELSRIMLALKGIFAGLDQIPSLIFDEIDSGISGITAGMVGEQMKDLARSKQIFAITHLPQIAALGHSHYLIYKEEQDKKTKTSIMELDSEARVKELARLLGGKNITKAVEETAREMLGIH